VKFGLREIVFIVLLMLIPVGAWWFVFRPQNEANAEMRRQIEARQAKLRELNKSLSVIGDLETEIGSLNEAIDYFESKLPDEKEIDKILQEIWMLAKSNDLQAKSIRTLTRTGGSGFVQTGSGQAEQPIAISLAGDFEGFYTFLMALENQPRIMRVSKMNISGNKNGLGERINVQFELSIFFDRNGKRI
jgi:Tfp pilus assembly protein PilO